MESDTYKLLEDYVQSRLVKNPQFPQIVQDGMNTVSGEIPFKLKLAIVVSELITFVSHVRKSIELHDGTLVPINAITVALSASGTNKDRTLNAMRRSLKGGYSTLEGLRVEAAKAKAIGACKATTGSDETWRQFYNEPKPLQAGLGTAEGLLHHFSDVSEGGVGAGSILSSEIGSELQTNSSMSEIIKTVSVAYDLGNVPIKIIKSSENQTKELKEFPVNALFFGSQEAILFNNEIKGRFKLAFNTQLARRSLFSFTPEPAEKLSITSIDELYTYREEERKRVLNAQETVSKKTDNLLASANNEPLEISPEADKLFDVYLEYNILRSENISNKYPITKLSQRHKQWLALKVAGGYSMLDGMEVITEEHYATAINTVELLAKDLEKFERELVKEPYEQLVDMCKYNAEEGTFFMSLHELRKLSYIGGTGAAKAKVEELVVMANSCDEHGNYTSMDNGIQYKEIIKTDTVGVSYLIFSSELRDKEFKEYASRNCSKGYQFYETGFDDLPSLLEENAAYAPFRFADGVRGKEHVRGGAKFVILDIDKSFLTYKEAHVLLNKYNHHIVQTSDPENTFKFRVLLELDSMVEVDEFLWKALIQVVGDELGLVVDTLPQSQIFLSFAGRDVLTQLEGETLDSKKLLGRAAEIVKDKPKPVGALPNKVKQQLLEDPRETFMFAFSAETGERSIKLYRALKYSVDLGANAEYVNILAHEINNSWMSPMDEDRLQRTLITPITRSI